MTKKRSIHPDSTVTEIGTPREAAATARSRNGLRLIKPEPDECQRSGAQAKPTKTPQSRVVSFMKAFADAVDADVAALRRL